MIKKRLIREASDGVAHIRNIVIFNLIALFCNVISIYQISVVLQNIIYQYQHNATFEMSVIIKAILIIVIASIIRYIFRIKTAKQSFLASGKIKYNLRDKLYNKLVSLGVSYEENVSVSQVVQLFSEGIEQMEIYFSRYLPQFFYSLIAPIILFVIISFFSLKVAVVLLLCVPLIPLSIVGVQKFAKKLLAKYWDKYTKLGDDFYENLQGLTTLKIYKADEIQQQQMNENAENFRIVTMKVLTMQLNSVSLMDLIAYMGCALGVIFSTTEFMSGHINFGEAFFIMMISSEFFIPLRLLGSYFHIAMNGMSASDRLFEILDITQDLSSNNYLENITDITLNDVSFSYNERPVIKNVSFDIKKGSFVGIVGESGSGKSTIKNLITGQCKNYEGDIWIGSTQVKTASSNSIAKNICTIKNENYLFKGTVRENLQIADNTATDEDMISVLKQVNLFDFLNSKQLLDTKLHENANNLSGGQRQRLSLARALLKDSPVYIFDEATSNIDVHSEDIILSCIESLKGSKTIIFISHRLTNVANADEILVFNDGKLVEKGVFKKLIQNKSHFYDMYQKQQELENFKKETENNEQSQILINI